MKPKTQKLNHHTSLKVFKEHKENTKKQLNEI